MRTRFATAGVLMLFAFLLHAGEPDFSDPARLPPPPAGAAGYPSRDPALDALPGFANPPAGYGEVAFYWWLGDPLTRERLTWQLDQLAGKGVAGLQVNYAHSDRGGRSYGLTLPSDPPLFSEAWWDLYGWFLKEARKRGMAVSLSDYTLGVGQGWYMDEILRDVPDLCGATLSHTPRTHEGGKTLQWKIPENTVSLMAYRLGNGVIEPGSGVDLRGEVHDGTLQWHAPAGRWQVIVVAFTPRPGSINPMHPLSGKKLIEKFFQRFEDRNPGEAGKGLNFFFSDELSFGVAGNLWDSRLADEFRRRKGYDLLAELPALFVDIGPRTPKVRLDYCDVLVSLEEENFFRPVFEWHYKRGMLYGCDHGGRGRNITEFGDYFRTQRWMTGTGNDQPHLSADIIKTKVNSSIVHLYQRPRVWLEGYYGSGWGTTSAQMADATFRNFVHGHSLLTFHGLYYSTHGGWWEWAPPCNHYHMPYWRHMGEFLHCAERLSYLLSQGHHCCDVAIVYPVAAVEAGMGGGNATSAAFGLGSHLYNQGIDFDFIDFESLDRAKVDDKKLCVSGEAYRVLILPAMRATRHSTLRKAAEFRRAGGCVIAFGSVPEATDRLGRGDPEVADLVKTAFDAPVENFQQVEEKIDRAFPRDFAVVASGEPAARPQILHRRAGNRDIYMVYAAPKDAECVFRAQGKVEIWDPWTGTARPLPILGVTADGTRLRLPLGADEAQLIVFSPGSPQIAAAGAAAAPHVTPIDGPWQFELEPVLDNRFGDYRWPPTPTMIGAEARQIRYADEPEGAAEGDSPIFGERKLGQSPIDWQDPKLDDAKWPKVTASFGPRFWKLGPMPSKIDVTALEARLATLTAVDPGVPVEAGGKWYRWQPYSFSWRWGVENDPGHQGYHGLKEEVPDEFIALGKVRLSGTGTSYEDEAGGWRYYLWTAALAPGDTPARALVGDVKPAAAWINSARCENLPARVQLKAGANPVLLRYDRPGRGYFVLDTSTPAAGSEPATSVPAAASNPASAVVQPVFKLSPLAMSWYNRPGTLPLDLAPQVARPAGWYRFTSPPGLRGMTITAFGKVRAWADGRPLAVKLLGQQDGASQYQVRLDKPAPGTVQIAIRIEQDRGCYGGAALPEPIALDCGPGTIDPGDWSRIDGLASYSGGAWYRKTITLGEEQVRGQVVLNLGSVVSSAEVRVNGRPAGIRVAPPWTLDVSKLVKPGENRLEILVYNTLANHYSTIPTRYRGSPLSGLLGPVSLETGR